ncbi:MAG TPA: hypothetical protein VE174_11990 [Actinomycetota bacterium]|nr:hypothetical protein [Actinomycetota bacterium]
MRKITALVATALLAGSLFAATSAPAAELDGPSAGGLSSDNVEFIKHMPIAQDGVGGRVVGDYFYANDQNKIMIFDLEDPLNPEMTGFVPMPQEWLYSREDLDTNGRILIMPNTAGASADGKPAAGTNALYVIDVEDKANPTIISKVVGGGSHTTSCVLDCTWAWGSDGKIFDLRNPLKPKLMKQKWGDGMPAGNGHDVEEIAPGLVLTATQPIMLLDVRKNPLKPKLLAAGSNDDGRFIHSGRWMNPKDKFLLMGGETNNKVRCSETNGAFMTWDASKWKKTHSFTMIDEYRVKNGTYADGNPAANQVGCSSHWIEPEPSFKNGGIVAGAFFEHGTKFLDVSSKGKIKETGWFMPAAGSTGAVYWITDKILYTLDYNRGIDILQWNG